MRVPNRASTAPSGDGAEAGDGAGSTVTRGMAVVKVRLTSDDDGKATERLFRKEKKRLGLGLAVRHLALCAQRLKVQQRRRQAASVAVTAPVLTT